MKILFKWPVSYIDNDQAWILTFISSHLFVITKGSCRLYSSYASYEHVTVLLYLTVCDPLHSSHIRVKTCPTQIYVLNSVCKELTVAWLICICRCCIAWSMIRLQKAGILIRAHDPAVCGDSCWQDTGLIGGFSLRMLCVHFRNFLLPEINM